MQFYHRSIHHIREVAQIPSFSTYEDRLHPYIRSIADKKSCVSEIEVEGNNLIYQIGEQEDTDIRAFAAHLDKNNHYGDAFLERIPVNQTETYLEGAMDDSVGIGLCLALMELWDELNMPAIQLYFSEMEESMGLKKHPELLKHNGVHAEHGMGAKRIAERMLEIQQLPQWVMTIDTTPLFKGDPGIALYTEHWEFNQLSPSKLLKDKTNGLAERLKQIHPSIQLANNTNDYLHYGNIYNTDTANHIPSVALEPAIYPYHQQNERVFLDDIRKTGNIIQQLLTAESDD